MFKILALLVCIGACAINALPTPIETENEPVPIIKSQIDKHDDGSYNLELKTADGTERKEEAKVVNEGTKDEALEVKGSYKYINEDGEEVLVTYTAGVNGYVPYSTIISPEISAVAEAAKELPKYEPEVKKSEYESA